MPISKRTRAGKPRPNIVNQIQSLPSKTSLLVTMHRFYAGLRFLARGIGGFGCWVVVVSDKCRDVG